MKQKKPKIKPGRGWAFIEGGKIRASQVWEWKSLSYMIPVIIIPLADYKELVKRGKK